jgi:TRAP-type C4-dicarboxylate transport system permease small subunit
MKILKLIDDSLEKVLCAILFTAMVICIVWQLIMRWTGGNLSWTEEAARYIFIWLAWIGMAESVRQRSHIKVELLTTVCKGGAKLFFDLLANVAFVIFCVVVFKLEYDQFVRVTFKYSQYSPAMQIPMGICYAGLCVGCVLMLYRLVRDTILLVQEYKAEKANNAKEGN